MPDSNSGLANFEHLTRIQKEKDLVILTFKRQTLELQGYFSNVWGDKNPFNVPGPFYCGLTDNCGTGIPAAPFNIMFDLEGREFIYRQPRHYFEVDNLLDAAASDPFVGYGWDGNYHWTLSLIREWWDRHDEFIVRLAQIKAEVIEPTIAYYNDKQRHDLLGHYPKEEVSIIALQHQIAILECETFWRDVLESCLRVYAFFIDTGKLPNESDTLPDL